MHSLSELQKYQPHAVETLRTALGAGRLHHALVFAGPSESRGLPLAKALAASLLCESPSAHDACGQCDSCQNFSKDVHSDLFTLKSSVNPDYKGKNPESQALEIRIGDVRAVQAHLSMRSRAEGYKIVLIEGIDTMRIEAQNAFLKTLEEPPGATIFLMTAVHWRRLLPTIRSRSQRLNMTPISHSRAQQILAEAGIPLELSGILAAIVGADVEEAESLLEQGAQETITAVANILQADSSDFELLELAADLSSTKMTTDLALTCVEIFVRDGLAKRHHADTHVLSHGLSSQLLDQQNGLSLTQATETLRDLRRIQAYNPNKTMVLERAFFAARGQKTRDTMLNSNHDR